MNITTSKSISQMTHYERDEMYEAVLRKYGTEMGFRILALAEQIDSTRKYISAWSAVDRAVEWHRRRRVEV